MENKWNLKDNVFESVFSVDDIINAIYVFEKLHEKYPNDEYIETSIEILRNEICQMFGGSIYSED
jgi:hypothetical protein